MIEARINLNEICLDYFKYVKRHSFKKKIISSVLQTFGAKQGEIIKINRALDGITAEFRKGDRIALIGQNGSGKSTLLRVLSGIYQPTSGSLEIQGRISSLLDIGVGMNLDITGYENIILIGILHGKTISEMKSKFKDIEEFTELKDFLKLPVKTYSSGMRLRLAFGIATCMESDILIIDEVIGVGDQNFMEKAKRRLMDLVHRSQILVLTSHFKEILPIFCNKSMVLNQGKCAYFGDLDKGIEFYNRESR